MINTLNKNIYSLLLGLLLAFFIGLFSMSYASAQTVDEYINFDSDLYSANSSEVTIDAIRFENDSDAWKIYYEANGEPDSFEINKNIIEGMLIITGFFIFFSMLAAILVLALIIPKQLEYAASTSRHSFWKTVAFGVIGVVTIPWVIFLLAISIIGLPLAGMVFTLALTAALFSGPFAGYAIGQLLVPDKNAFLKALIGGMILLILYFVPIVNILALLGAYTYGVGMIINLGLGYRLNDK